MDESYYPHAEAAAHGLSLELLLATSASAALPRHGSHLSDFAPPTMLGSRLYHRLAARGEMPRCIWVAGPMETLEHLGWAVALAEHAARDRKTAYLLDLDPSQPLRVYASGAGRPLRPDVIPRLSVLGIPAAAAWPSDLEGVRVVLPERRNPTGIPIASVQDWIIVIAQSIPDSTMGVLAPRPGIDGVIFAAGIRDHTVRELRGAIGAISSAGLPILGLVSMGPVRPAGAAADRGAGGTQAQAPPSSPAPPRPRVIPIPIPPARRAEAPFPREETSREMKVPGAHAPSSSPAAPAEGDGARREEAVVSSGIDAGGELVTAEPAPVEIASAPRPTGLPGPLEPIETAAPTDSAEEGETREEEKPIPVFADWHETSRSHRRGWISVLLVLALATVAAGVFYRAEILRQFQQWTTRGEPDRTVRAADSSPEGSGGLSTTPPEGRASLDTMTMPGVGSPSTRELRADSASSRIAGAPADGPATGSAAAPDTFVVYAGSFASRFDALDLVAILRAAGKDARVVSVLVPGMGLRHRVILGAFPDAVEAGKESARLRQSGLVRDPQVVDSSGRAPANRSLLR